MKSYEQAFIDDVLSQLDGRMFFVHSWCGNTCGGIPDFFYDKRGDVVKLESKRRLRTKKEIEEDKEIGKEEFEAGVLLKYGFLGHYSNTLFLENIKRDIRRADEYFNVLLKFYREASDEYERSMVSRRVVFDIIKYLKRGANLPFDFFFLRRFGIYG